MYQPTLESIKQHPLPDWYQDAKFGIFVHWTISSVPAFAPTGLGDIGQIFAKKSEAYAYAHQPYAEWYQNSLRIKDSPVYDYHKKTYGENYPYEAFAGTFNQQSQNWDPQAWADLFSQAGARYVVLVTKHHDGFLLWDSQYPNPHLPDYRSTRDVTGELARSLTANGLKMGLYYSSALDWTFNEQPVLGFADLLSTGPTGPAYAGYVENHLKELIDRYSPWLLWSDIGYPTASNLPELFAYFYNHNAEGVVNDRWFQLARHFYNPLGKIFLRLFAKQIMNSGGTTLPNVPHCDFRTAEYLDLKAQMPYKWELVRGIGNSFTYNQFEEASDYQKAADLIRMLADIVSKNGNLLLNVGPRPDGSIPEPQVQALQGIGNWLTVNGDAIYGTRPFTRAADELQDGLKVRYTRKGKALYIIIINPPTGAFRLPNLPVLDGSQLTLLETNQPLEWHRDGKVVEIMFPAGLDWDSVPVLRVETL